LSEESFKVYQDKVISYCDTHLEPLSHDPIFESTILEDHNIKDHKTLNFYLPHDFGGCGTPQ